MVLDYYTRKAELCLDVPAEFSRIFTMKRYKSNSKICLGYVKGRGEDEKDGLEGHGGTLAQEPTDFFCCQGSASEHFRLRSSVDPLQ